MSQGWGWLCSAEGPFRAVFTKCFLFCVFGLHKSLQRINTHVPSSVQHAAQSHFFFFSPCSHPFHRLDDQIISDRPRLFMQLCECVLSPLSPADGDVHSAQKSRDTREPLQYDRPPLFVQAPHAVRLSEPLQPSMKAEVRVGAAFWINSPRTCQLQTVRLCFTPKTAI